MQKRTWTGKLTDTTTSYPNVKLRISGLQISFFHYLKKNCSRCLTHPSPTRHDDDVALQGCLCDWLFISEVVTKQHPMKRTACMSVVPVITMDCLGSKLKCLYQQLTIKVLKKGVRFFHQQAEGRHMKTFRPSLCFYLINCCTFIHSSEVI